MTMAQTNAKAEVWLKSNPIELISTNRIPPIRTNPKVIIATPIFMFQLPVYANYGALDWNLMLVFISPCLSVISHTLRIAFR